MLCHSIISKLVMKHRFWNGKKDFLSWRMCLLCVCVKFSLCLLCKKKFNSKTVFFLLWICISIEVFFVVYFWSLLGRYLSAEIWNHFTISNLIEEEKGTVKNLQLNCSWYQTSKSLCQTFKHLCDSRLKWLKVKSNKNIHAIDFGRIILHSANKIWIFLACYSLAVWPK